jgi:N-glycosylase/DNA lyase
MGATTTVLEVVDYDLAATLTSGQAFRWRQAADGWEGVVGRRWVRLRAVEGGIEASTADTQASWDWLEDYLQARVKLGDLRGFFPADDVTRRVVAATPGLRLLRQDPWECLASFILSSTKQIVQISQIVELLCERWGEALKVPAGHEGRRAFPEPGRLAEVGERALRECKMGFRAAYLHGASSMVAGGFDLEELRTRPLAEARAALMTLPGVGRKIADCVLLFSLGFDAAFPMDVWIRRGLGELYFGGRPTRDARMEAFAVQHFGPFGGHVQQHLFHYLRTRGAQDERTRRL